MPITLRGAIFLANEMLALRYLLILPPPLYIPPDTQVRG